MRRIKSILEFAIGVMIIIVSNQIIDRIPTRLDLTEEKRYSISAATIDLLKNLQEPVYIEVYLEGEMPSGFKRLQNGIKETLGQFQYYSSDQVNFSFVNPSAGNSKKARNEYYSKLVKRGIPATNLSYNDNGNKVEKLIFPAAMVSYFGKEQPVILLKGNRASSSEERLNQSIEGLEYELANGIRLLANDRRKSIGLIKGHNEPDSLHLAGLTNALLEKYNVYEVDLPSRTKELNFDAIILPKPTTAFSEIEKYKIDQFIMNGGKALFFIDALRVNMDSASGDGTFAFPYELRLDDLLFKYGVRINRNFVQDIVCGDFPVVAGNLGDQPQIRLLPWPFFPMINSFGDHPIVKNLDAISVKFASTIDTVKADGITKIPLLSTSEYSLVSDPPVKVSFNELQKKLDPARFSHGSKNVSYLLNGKFQSAFKNRILPKGVNTNTFISNGIETSILVCADGDMIRNEFDLSTGEPMELGASPYNQIKYANGDFVLNTLEYMFNKSGIISSKSKEVKIRPLDKVKIAKEKLYWQLFNLFLPLIMLVLFGTLRVFWRKRKYARHS
ncbi:MAG: gliding motility-associated ABC transporter substrate-binding protein GldG [Reichenbachiella sp.]